MDYKKIFAKNNNQVEKNAFTKTNEKIPLSSNQKVALNRKGNVLYNSGDIEGAKRIFLTTGYSDGLSRIGDYYKTQGRLVDALKMYWIAPDHTKSEPILIQISALIQNLIQEEGDDSNEK
jgi:tetratricopeptide (TPR) repeat protein